MFLSFSLPRGFPGPPETSVPRRNLMWCWCVVVLLSAVVTIYISGVPLSCFSPSLSHKHQHHDNPEPDILDTSHPRKLRN